MEHDQLAATKQNSGPISPQPVDVDRSPVPQHEAQQSREDEQAKTDLLSQTVLTYGYFHDVLTSGINNAMSMVDSPTISTLGKSWLWDTMVIAVQAAVAAAAGGAAYEFAAFLELKGLDDKIAGDGCKDLIKSAYKAVSPGGGGKKDAPDAAALHTEYRTQLLAATDEGQRRLAQGWPAYAKRLRAMSNADLAAMNRAALSIKPEPRQQVITKQVLEGWYNFVARAAYGAGPKRDPWDPNAGVYATSPDAAPEGYFGSDSTVGNVDARNAAFRVTPYTENEEFDAHAGMLEIRVAARGDDYVPTNVRMSGLSAGSLAHIRTLGRVGDLHVNKIVSIMKHSEWGVKSYSMVITADGRLRMIDEGSNLSTTNQDQLLRAWDVMHAAQSCSLEHLEAV